LDDNRLQQPESQPASTPSTTPPQTGNFEYQNARPADPSVYGSSLTSKPALAIEEMQAASEIGGTATLPVQKPKQWWRWVLLAVGAITISLMFWLLNPLKSNNSSSLGANKSYQVTTIPLSDLAKSGQLSFSAQSLAVNGQLTINNSAVLAPSDEPTNPQTGQLYLSRVNNQLYYYNGSGFVNLATGDQLANLGLGSLSRVSSVGQGLNLAGGTLQNTGVLSVQGQTGAVSFVAGGGVAINGLAISNTGVTGINGTAGQIAVSAASGNVTLSLPQNIGPTATPTFAGLNLTGPLSVASGGTGVTAFATNSVVVSNGSGGLATSGSGTAGECLRSNGAGSAPSFQTCPGGNGAVSSGLSQTPGALVKFDTTFNQIVDSLVSESGATVTVGGALTVSGTITGNGSGLTVLNASSLSSGTVADGRLSANVALLNAGNGFTGVNTFSNPGNSFTGNGSGLTNVNAAQLNGQSAAFYQNATNITAGTLSDLRLSANVALLGNTQSFTGVNTFSQLVNANGGVATSNGNINAGTGTITSGAINGQTISSAANFTGTIAFATLGASGSTLLCRNGSGQIAACSTSATAVTLQQAYDASTNPEFVLDATRGALTVRDAATPLGANLLEVQSNNGGVTYLAVSAAGTTITGTLSVSSTISGVGSGLTALNASNISSGTLNDGRLSANVALLNGANTFTGANIFNNVGNAFTGDGSGLANVDADFLNGNASSFYLNASNINAGTLAIARGGTGLGTTPTNGQLLIGNGAGYTLSTLTAGTGISISNSAGGITINNTASGASLTLQGAYDNALNGSTAKIKVDSTRLGVDIQDADTTINGNLFSVRGSNAGGLGALLFNVNSLGNVAIGGASTVNRLYVPWLAGDTATTAYFGSLTSGNDQNALQGMSNSGTGVYGESITGYGIQGTSSNSVSGFFQSSNATNLASTLVARAANLQTSDLIQAQNFGGGVIARIDVSGGLSVTSAAVNGNLTASGATNLNSATVNLNFAVLGNKATINSGSLGVGTANPSSKLHVVETGTLADENGNGTDAVSILTVLGGKGGNTLGTTGEIGGHGAHASITAGDGGDADVGGVNGDGGSIFVQGGLPGSGAGTAGNFGNVIMQQNGGNVAIGSATAAARLDVKTGGVNSVGLAVQATAGQISDLLQIKNSSGGVVGAFDAGGNLILGKSGPTGGADGQLVFKNSAGANTILLQGIAATADRTINLPDADGTVAVSASGPLSLDASGNLSCATCLTSGGGGAGGVSSLNTLTGALTIQGTTNRVTVTPSGSTLTLSTPQDINTTSAPTFAGLTVNGNLAVSTQLATSTTTNRVTVGNADNTSSANTTLLVVDSASTANLPTGVNGGIVYDGQLNKFKIYENGQYKVLCNTTDLGCGSAGPTVNLQTAYDSSTNPEIVVDATRGALTVRDASTPLGANLFEVQSNNGTATYFGVTATGVSVQGTLAVSGATTLTGQLNANGGIVTNNGNINAGTGTVTGNGSGLSNLNASNLATGTVNDLRLSANVTLQGNTFNGANQLVQLDASTQLPAVSGALLTSLNASNVSSGTLSDTRLSSNVPLKNGTNTFTGVNTFSNAGNSFTGDGSGLTSLNASNVSSGTLNDARLSTNVALLDRSSQVFTGSGAVFRNTANTATAFRVQDALATNTLFTANTSNNRVAIGDADNTSAANTTLLVVDSASTANLPAGVNGGLIYDSQLNQFKIYENGQYKVICNQTDGNCGGSGGGATLQTAYNASSSPEIVLDATRGALTVRDASSALGANLLEVQSNNGATTYLAVTATGTSVTGTLAVSGVTTLTGQLNANGGIVTNNGNINAGTGTVTGNGSGLTSLNASNLASGTVNDLRLSANVTLQGNTFNGNSQLVQLDGTSQLPAVSGALLTSLNASNVSSGTLNDARLSSNVPLKNGTNTFTGANTFSNAGNSFTGDGSGLTSLNASNVSSGTLNDARLSTNVALLDRSSQVFTGSGAVFRNTANTATAFRVQDALATNTLFTANTTNNRVAIGDADNTSSANTTLLVVDSASTANLPTGVNGGIVYDGQLNKFKIYENGQYKVLCNTTDLSCGSFSPTVTLQVAYDASTNPELVLDATRGALTVRDASSALGANLLEVQSNNGATTYLAVAATGTSITGTLAVSGATTLTGQLNANGGIVTNNANITAGTGTVTSGAVNGQTISSAASFTGTLAVATLGSTGNTPVCLNGSNLLASCVSNAAVVTLQQAYNASANPELVVDATRGALTVRDASSPLGANLLEVQDNGGGTTYFAVSATGVTVSGAVAATGAINSSGSGIQTAGTTRIDNSGNLTNIGNITGTGAVTLQSTSGTLALTATGTNIITATTNSTQRLQVDSTGLTLAASSSLTVTGSTTFPSSPVEGQVYYRTDTKQLYVYANGKWQADRSASTKIVADGSTSQNPERADYVVPAAGTSAQTTINAAISALPVGGGTVYLVEGTYTVDGSVTIPANVTLTGSGAATIIKVKTSLNASIDVMTNAANANRVVVSNLKLDGNKSNNTSGVQDGINFSSGANGGTPGAKIDKVWVENFRNDGIQLNSSYFSSITNSSVVSNTGNGVFVNGGSNNTFSSNTSYGNGTAGYRMSSSYLTVTNNTAEANATGFTIIASTGSSFTGNIADSNTGSGFFVTSANTTISGNTSRNNSLEGISIGSNSDNNVVSGNSVMSNGSNGISIGSSSSGNIVSGNKVDNNGGSGGNSGITVVTGATNNSIIGNDITDTAGTGFAISISTATIKNTYVSGNRFSGTGASSISDNGTGTIFDNQMNSNGDLVTTAQRGLAVGTATATSSLTLQGGLTVASIPAPATPTITKTGTAGTSTYGYKVTALDGLGESLPSVEGSISTGFSPLDATHFTTVTWATVGGAFQYKVYRTTVSGGGSPATTGLIGTVAATVTSLNDTGLAASGSAPTTNTTGGGFFSGAVTIKNTSDTTAAFQIQNAAGTSNLLVADTVNTRVGIGTNTPQATLHVSATGAGGDLFRITDTTATAQDVVKIADGGAATFRNQTNSASAFAIQNSTGGSLFLVDSTNSNISINGNNTGEVQTWQTNANTLTAIRQNTRGIAANGYVYVVGGHTGGTKTATVMYAKLNADGSTDTWQCQGTSGVSACNTTPINSNGLPAVRGDHGIATANGYIYVVGGHDSSNTAVATVYYAKLNADGTTGVWQTNTANPLPLVRDQVSSFAVNGYLYAIGGNDGSSSVTTSYVAKLNADGTTGAWTTTTALPQARSYQSMTLANGYVYSAGGVNAAGTTTSALFYSKVNTDGTLGTWSCQGVVGECAAATISNTNALSDSRRGADAVALNGYLYVMGGRNNAGTMQSTVYYAKFNANGTTGIWTAATNTLGGGNNRYMGASAVANGYIYYMGGDSTGANVSQSTVYYTSLSRTKIAGSLDLVGTSGQDLLDGGSQAGSLTSGNTDVLGHLGVRGSATILQGLAVGDTLTVSGNALFKNNSDSATGFQVQNSGGTAVLNADTTNARIGIGTASPSASLHISAAGAGTDLFRITDTTATSQDVVKVADGGALTLRNQTDSASALLIQNATAGTNALVVDTTGTTKVTVQNLVVAVDITVNGHIITGGTAPTAAVQTAAGSTATCSVTGSNDTGGTITLASSGTGQVTGAQCILTFNSVYSVAPRPVIAPTGANGTTVNAYVTATTTTMTLNFNTAATAGQTYTFNYFNAQ
jgi:fibronectin-binding autotransporter adhesin